jgi:hypothetical protein
MFIHHFDVSRSFFDHKVFFFKCREGGFGPKAMSKHFKDKPGFALEKNARSTVALRAQRETNM